MTPNYDNYTRECLVKECEAYRLKFEEAVKEAVAEATVAERLLLAQEKAFLGDAIREVRGTEISELLSIYEMNYVSGRFRPYGVMYSISMSRAIKDIKEFVAGLSPPRTIIDSARTVTEYGWIERQMRKLFSL